MARSVLAIWRCRWGLVRLSLAAFCLWALAADTGGRLARRALRALPDFDYVAEVRYLREAGRYGEAIVVADAGLRAAESDGAPWSDDLRRERDATLAEQRSVLRRVKAVGAGALTGSGDSLEGLGGAIAADFFLFGDVRDLAIQGARWTLDGEADEVILALSAIGVATTLAPEVDWVPSLLKAARRAGTLTDGLAGIFGRAAKGRDLAGAKRVMGDVRVLADKSSPGGAVRLLAHADSPEDVATLARFCERTPDGAFALHVTGADGASIVKRMEGPTRSVGVPDAARVDDALVAAAKKGNAGVAFTRTRAFRAMLRPHPLVGLCKGLYKGNVSRAIERAMARLGPHAWWLIPLLAAWVFVEGALVARRVRLATGARRATASTVDPRGGIAPAGMKKAPLA